VTLAFRKKLVASLIYPALLITLVIGMFIFMVTFVVPQFAKRYDQSGTSLPAITLVMLSIGRISQQYILYILPLVAVGVFLLWRWSRTDAGAERIDSIRIALPVFGKIWLKYQVAMFARTLSTLLTGGIPLVPSLETAARSITSKRISKAVFSSVVSVREGKGLALSLQGTKVFPDLSTEMIEVGESTGALPQMLNSVAEFFEEDVQTALTAALALIEPAILIVMGVVVVIILISLYLPIFSMGNTMGGGH
jgi:type IV pilus assembly protein PilC